MRPGIAALVVALAASGCGGADEPAARDTRAAAGTLEALWRKPGEDVTLVNGTSDHAPGLVRFSFLVVTHSGRVVLRPRARVYVASSRRAAPFVRTTASLEPVGAPGAPHGHDEVTKLYVARLRIERPGTYWLVAEPVGGTPIQGLANLIVKPKTDSPAVGARAYPSLTPTLDSTDGDTTKLTTRVPPDIGLLRYSVAGSLRAHKPFVLVFATPEFCTSRTCGPVVDVVDRVRRDFVRTDMRFIHVEIYEDNDPAKGTNRWVREWRLPSEPWIFLVGRDGRIMAKFEGSVSVAELRAAVRRQLV